MLRRNSFAFLLSLLFISIQILGCGSGKHPVTISGTLPATGTVGAGYTGTLTATGGEGGFTWTATGLPPGIMASGNTTPMLTVSGTPTTAGSYAMMISVTDAKSDTQSYSVTLVISSAAGVTISGTLPATGTVGAAYTGSLTASGGTAPYTWTVTGLPAGVTPSGLTTATITTAGTPTAAGTFPVSATVTDSATHTATYSVSVVIAPAAANLSVRLPAGYPVSGTVGTAYTAPAPTVAGGTPPYTYIFAQNAPPGLTMAPTTGIVTGTPTKVGTFNPAIKVTDSATPPNAAFTNYVFVVSASGGQTLAIGPTTLGTLTNGTAVTPITLTSTPATTEPYTWSVTSGALPAGLVLNNGTTTNTSNITSSTNSINITGTPTTTGPYSFTLSVTDSAASVGNGSQAFSGSVSASTPTTACAATPALRGNEAALTTPFAFLLEGFDGTGAPLAWAGSFTPDGTGKVTNADLDFVGTTAGAQSIQVNTSSSSYSYGADGRGCLYLTFTGQTPGVRPEEKLRPAALVNGGAVVLSFAVSLGYETGRMQQFDYVTSTVVATGEMHEQTASDFAVSEIASNFAFGYDGWVAVPAGLAKVAIAGSFENSSGTLSLGAADENIAGTASGLLTGGSGSLDATVSATTGRGTGSYTAPTTEGTLTFTFAYYIVNGSDLFIISTNDPTTQGSYLLSGRALKSLPTSVALDGYYIPALMGIDLSATPLTTSTTVGTLNVTTGGAFTTHIYNNTAGTYTSTGPSGTSTFTTATGRVTFPGWTNGPVGYVTATADEDGIAAFLVGTDTDTSSGFLALQGTTAPNFTASNISGTYAYSSGGLPGSASGAYAFVSAPPTFNATTDVVTVGETASKPDQASNGPFVVNPDGTGTVNGNTVFTTNGALIIGFDTTSTQPQLSIWVSETLVP